jgi:hypothetical protein
LSLLVEAIGEGRVPKMTAWVLKGNERKQRRSKSSGSS